MNRTVEALSRGVPMAMVNVTLPDGTVNEYAAGVTAGEVVIDALGKKHGCLAARINDVERDLSTSLTDDCNLEGILADSDEGIHILRHSAAHLLASSREFAACQLVLGDVVLPLRARVI